ncbi:MAG: hypothetical protein AAGH15_05325 [Myxococcota bacterium]
MKYDQKKWILVAALSALVACGSDDDAPTDAGVIADGGGARDAAADAGTPGDAGTDEGVAPDAGAEDPLFLLVGAVFSPDGAFGYIYPTPELSGDVMVALEDSLEIPVAAGGGSFAVPDPPTGQLFIGSGESPIIERYGIDAEGTFTLENRFSLAGLGWAAGGSVVLVSPTKGYTIDGATLTAVEFDPVDMAIVEELPLDGLDAGEDMLPETSVRVDGDRILVHTRYFRDSPLSATETRLAVIDTTDNSIVYDTQTDCANLLFSVVTETAIYYSPHANQASFFASELSDNAPCAKRVLRGESSFDDTYRLDLNALAGGPSGPLVPGSTTSSYLLVYDDSVLGPIGDGSAFLPVWRFVEIDLDAGTRIGPVEEFPLTTGAGLGFQVPVDGELRSYSVVAQFGEGGVEASTAFDVTDPDNVAEAFETPGFLVSAVRVR